VLVATAMTAVAWNDRMENPLVNEWHVEYRTAAIRLAASLP
jgi:hypothetical protein